MIHANPENQFSPLPEYLESYRGAIKNFGLYFQKFAQYNWDNGQRGETKKTYEWSLINNQFDQYKKHFSFVTLTKKHENQRKYLSVFSGMGVKVLKQAYTTSTRFLTGIGETTPTEVGMVFDRNSGLPYIPAASVKGAVRYAYCVNFARKYPEKIREGKFLDEKNVDGLIELFGSLNTKNSSRGGYAFMDVYSEKPPEIAIDIMNPHFRKYLDGESNDGPVETEEPVPIKFLAVEKGAIFQFRGFFLSKEAESYWDQLNEAYITALTEIGIGAKTAVGYGRFVVQEVDVKANGEPDNPEPVDESDLKKNFDAFRLSPSPENFKKFIKNIKPEDIEELTELSFREVTGSINIGFAGILIEADVSEDIKSIVGAKTLKLIKKNKKWNQSKRDRYSQLQILAGQKQNA